MTHLKRIATPKSWPISRRKGISFIARPNPGPHKLSGSMPLNVVIKEILNIAKTTRETKRLLNNKKILIDGKPRKDYKLPIGLMDVIEIPEINQQFILLYDEKGKFALKPITKEESQKKILKIINKNILKKNRTQLNFYNGTNLQVEKDVYRTGDSVIMQGKEIKKHLKFEKGAIVYLTGGKHKGKIGLIDEIHQSSQITKGEITVKIEKEKITTRKDFAYVIEKHF